MRILKSALFVLALVVAMPALGAAGTTCPDDWDYFGLPDLTGDQKAKMDELRMSFLRESLVRVANVNALSVEAGVLVTAEKPDVGQIQQKVDQITKLTGEISHAGLKLLLGVKGLLKKEQVKVLDSMILAAPEVLLNRGGQGGSKGGTGLTPSAIQGGSGTPMGVQGQGGSGGQMGQMGQMGQGGQGAPAPEGSVRGAGGPAAAVTGGALPPCDGRSGPCQGACSLEDAPKAKKK